MRDERTVLSGKDLFLFSIFFLVFLILCYWFWDFEMDDAYITYRFSENVANGHGAVWNPGDGPIEGFSSFLWMVLMAGVIYSGQDPVLASKIISLAAALASIVMVYMAGLSGRKGRVVPFIAASALAFNPAFAVMTMQGLETTLAAFLVLACTFLTMRIFRKHNNRDVAVLGVLLFLAFLTRPDLVVFGGVLTLSLLLSLRKSGDNVRFRASLTWLSLTLFFPAAIYMAWRISYFGHFFPNAFYVKQTASSDAFLTVGGILGVGATIEVFRFIALMMGPYVLVLTSTLMGRGNEKHRDRFLREGFPVALALLAFVLLYCFINPVQGYLFRFQMPAFPSFLLLFAVFMPDIQAGLTRNDLKKSFESLKSRQGRRETPGSQRAPATLASKLIVLFMVVLLALLPMHTLAEAREVRGQRYVSRMVYEGEALEPLADRNYTLLASEIGVVPYYSKWRSTDNIGLVDEKIAHEGLTREYLDDLAPELVMLGLGGLYHELEERFPLINDYMVDEGYIGVTAVEKWDDGWHVYFVRPGPWAGEIADALLSHRKLINRNPLTFVGEEIDIWPTWDNE